MTIVIDKKNSKNISKLLGKKLSQPGQTGNLAKHYGKLKRKIDGLKYQISIRDNED